MTINRTLKTKSVKKFKVRRYRTDIFLTAYHNRRPHKRVVNSVRKCVRRDAVAFNQNKIFGIGIRFYFAFNKVIKLDALSSVIFGFKANSEAVTRVYMGFNLVKT